MAASGETSRSPAAPSTLTSTSNPWKPWPSSGVQLTSSTRASGGASSRRAPPRTRRARPAPLPAWISHDTVGVADPAREVVALGQAPDERPEPHALHDAADLEIRRASGSGRIIGSTFRRRPRGRSPRRARAAPPPPPATCPGRARTSPTSTPRNTTFGNRPERRSQVRRPRPARDRATRGRIGAPAGTRRAPTRPDDASRDRGAPARVRIASTSSTVSAPSSRSRTCNAVGAVSTLHVGAERARRAQLHRHESGRVVTRVGVPAADDPDARHDGLRRARRRPEGNGSRTRCRGRSSAPPSRTGA